MTLGDAPWTAGGGGLAGAGELLLISSFTQGDAEAVDSHAAKTCVYFLRVLSPAAEVQEGLGRDPQSWYLRTGVLVCWGSGSWFPHPRVGKGA